MSAPSQSSVARSSAKPRLRGVSHVVAFFVSLGSGPALLALAPTLETQLVVALYALTQTGMFGVSALLHRRSWSSRGYRRMLSLDHAMIFVFIGGAYTAIGGLTLAPELGRTLLPVVWAGALAGALVHVVWVDLPKWLSAIPYLAVGWVAVVAAPQLLDRLGWIGFGLLLSGGVLYSIGALVYARRWPYPLARVFGYHEVFHLLVVAAAVAQYVTLAVFVLPLR